MKSWLCTMGLSALAITAVAADPAPKAEISWEKLEIDKRMTLDYALALPADVERLKKGEKSAKSSGGSPLLVVLPGGPGAKEMVEGAMDCFADEATAKGWIVASPQAPNGELFFQGGERALEPLVRHLCETFKVEKGQVHIAGISNGGIGALHAIARHPELWASVLTLPGAVMDPVDTRKLGELKGKSITLYAGEEDELGYHTSCQQLAQMFDAKKIPYTLNLKKGEGHMMDLPGSVLVDDLERHRKAVPSGDRSKPAEKPKAKAKK